MGDDIRDMEFQYFTSLYKTIKVLKKTDRVNIELVYYEPQEITCVLKTYYGRDLTDVYSRLKQIRHENLAVVFDVLLYGGDTYIIEEMISGETLAQYLGKHGPLSEKQVIRIMLELCKGLQLLHCQKPPLVHRDIKPSNVMIREDKSVKLIDFDAARTYREEEQQDTTLLGTKEYASPEHYGYGQTGPSSDIYSLGVMMNELLTGTVLTNHQATYQGRLKNIINHCIEIDSKRRYQSVSELDRAIKSDCHWWGFLSRNKKKATVCLVVLLIMASIAVVSHEQGAGWPDLKQLYESQASPFVVLEHPKVEARLTKLLGNRFSYVEECFTSVDDIQYSQERYFMSGGVPGLYTIMEAAISVSENGVVECGFLEDGVCHYYTSQTKKERPSDAMLQWLSSYPEYEIQFQKNQQYSEPEEISGTYVNTDLPAYIQIRKSQDGSTYEVEGNATRGADIGELEGEIRQSGKQNYLYSEQDTDHKLVITAYADCIVVSAEYGSLGGSNVSFNGIYEKQQRDQTTELPVSNEPESVTGTVNQTDAAADQRSEETSEQTSTESQESMTVVSSAAATEASIPETLSSQPESSVSGERESKSEQEHTQPGFLPQFFSVAKPEGELLSMVSKPDDSYYMILKRATGYYLAASDGREIKLGDEGDRQYRAYVLSYNPYKDELYLLATTGNDLWIFGLDQNLNQTEVYRSDQELIQFQTYSSCEYFSDGMMLCGNGGNLLIDTNSWLMTGRIKSQGKLKVIGDQLYQMDTKIKKLNFEGDVVKEYGFNTDGADASGYPGTRFLSDGSFVYFAKEDGFYQFDGESLKPYLIVKDFRYVTKLTYDFLCVTEKGIRYYDWSSDSIKEIHKK